MEQLAVRHVYIQSEGYSTRRHTRTQELYEQDEVISRVICTGISGRSCARVSPAAKECFVRSSAKNPRKPGKALARRP